MSSLNVNSIDKESGSTLSIGGSGTTVNVSNMVPDVALSNRNLIINGAMNVAQRGTQVTGVTGSGYHTCDRHRVGLATLGTWTIDQSTDSPNGFSNSLKLTCTTADASPAAGDIAFFGQRIEGQNLQHLGFGTADAKSMTLSFWVKSNKTGAASFGVGQIDNSNKMFSNSYTINSADTWEYKTISIPADTAGQINNDNGIGLEVYFWLNSGSNFQGGSYATTWSTYDATRRNPSNLGVGGAVNDYFAITGVQLEVGDVATPFEHESFGETLAKCKRYFESIQMDYSGKYVTAMATSGSGTWANLNVDYEVSKRATPTITQSVTARNGTVLAGGGSTASASTASINSNFFRLTAIPTGLQVGYPVHFYNNPNSSWIQVDAEL